MKSFVVLAGFFAVCASNAIPTVPGDNSHYVEGESRYIWIPDGNGYPHLVDLEDPVDEAALDSRDGSNNAYWLYTRENPTIAQILVHNDANSVYNSNYQGSRPLMVICHGWNSNGNSDVNTVITSAYLAVEDANVIVLDWSRLADSLYNIASNGVPSVGAYLGNFLEWLINTGGGSWDNVHLVGHSLGAHVVGNAGRTVGGRPRRITGLDPAGPVWGNNPNALKPTDGQYVESIHTNGGTLGIMDRSSDADFYPNGGRSQPGCTFSVCSHGRSHDLFASTVRTNHLVARQCDDMNQAENVQCSGAAMNMGNAILSKSANGIYGLRTESSWPY